MCVLCGLRVLRVLRVGMYFFIFDPPEEIGLFGGCYHDKHSDAVLMVFIFAENEIFWGVGMTKYENLSFSQTESV